MSRGLSKDTNHRLSIFLLTLLLLILVFPLSSAQESLNVTFEFVSIEDTTNFRGMSAGFPNYVLSLITVQDQDNRYVHGLADTSRWLLPTDTTETGALVDSVWRVILEYHEEDTTKPANPDVKEMLPDYQVTELYDVEGFGLSVSLAMDYSGSMGDGIYVSEDAAKVFVRQMTQNDRAAIVKFTGKVQVFQEFTSDTTLLMEAITEPTEDREYTSLFDAIYKAISLTMTQMGRRAVVAYTDGKDNNSSQRIEDVIALAQSNNIPVFTIGLGDEINAVNLRRIADETGGVYLHAETVDDLADIYISIFGLIRGFYVMAHTTTDPYYNGTWRFVDLTLKHEEAEGRGRGRYYVPFIPADLGIHKRAMTDSMSVVNGDTLYYAVTGDTISYEICVSNESVSLAGDVEIQDVPDDSVRIVDFETAPDEQGPGGIVWRLGEVEPGETLCFRYRVAVDTLYVGGLWPLVNQATVSCDMDTSLSNNTAQDTVYYTPLTNLDVVVHKKGFGKYVAVSEGDSIWYVYPGDTVEYRIALTNIGEQDCQDLQAEDILPPELTLVTFGGPDYTLDGDTLAWTVSGLESRGGTAHFTYTCRVNTLMPPWSVPLGNRVEAFCPGDADESNNTAQDTVWVVGVEPGWPEVRVSPSSVHEGDDVQVEVMTPIHVESWDLRVFFEGDVFIDTYGDDFIQDTDLEPAEWTTVIPDFSDTWMSVGNPEESVGVVFETRDVWDVVRSDTAYFVIQALYPEVRVSPISIEPLDSVKVEAMSPVEADGWDLSVLFEDGSRVDTYADAFIQANPLVPEQWTSVAPSFDDTQMRTYQEEEAVQVVLETVNVRGIARYDTASFTIQSSNEFFLDDNVFKPDDGTDLGMRFKLSSNRRAVIVIYDISGAFVAEVIDGPYVAGWNTTVWDGRDANGVVAGSGVYLAVLTSGNYQKARKFIVVR